MENGWIKIHRKILEWEWWDDPKTFRLFMYLLLSANHRDKKWRGKVIKKGQVLTGLYSLAKSTKLSVQSVRTSLNKLKSTGEITNESTPNYRIITILNWDKHQIVTNNSTSEQQTTNKRLTTTKNDKNDKKKTEKAFFGELGLVKLTEGEHQKLKDILGDRNTQELIFELDTYLGSSGKKYKSHYATILNWAKRRADKQKQNHSKFSFN